MGTWVQAWNLEKRLISVCLVGSSRYSYPGDWVGGRLSSSSGFPRSLMIQSIPSLLDPIILLVSQ